MKKHSVVSESYIALQKEILSFQDSWKNELEKEAVVLNNEAFLETKAPAVLSASIKFDPETYIKWIIDLASRLEQENAEVEGLSEKASQLLDKDIAERWFSEALSFNNYYFAGFAEEHSLPEWVPHYLAEQAVRPYLRLLADEAAPYLDKAENESGCPVCGEPVRLSHLEGEGKKVADCPRCHASWQEKRLSCTHCGNDDHDTLQYLQIEGDSVNKIQVCKECNGYMKIIDSRQLLKKPAPSLLDIQTIHLDFVAQDKGYGTGPSGEETVS
ncbi:formate dehydrogenase accessory protein FdhE [Bacillus marinisedimentorum]|uniref:formate dehydrogenase accessory protein FdhE n=1 Tax=Bacillus marinisedimentorum TaxID=1821260 RepID=UPI0008733BAA|nr:formate dehydrogenase accessory protein FdhE [Bacillus marinisedimentorum]